MVPVNEPSVPQAPAGEAEVVSVMASPDTGTAAGFVTVTVTVVVDVPLATTAAGLAETATVLFELCVIPVEPVKPASASLAVIVQVPPVVLEV